MKSTYLKIAAVASVLVFVSCSAAVVTDNEQKNKIENTSVNENTEQNQTSQIAEDVNAEKFKSLYESGKGVLIDVRTPEEFNGGTIEGAVNLNYSDGTFESSLDTLDKNQPIYVFCQAGGRSGKAKDILVKNGFTEVYNLIGGYGSWPY